jgi:hypothetical protein
VHGTEGARGHPGVGVIGGVRRESGLLIASGASSSPSAYESRVSEAAIIIDRADRVDMHASSAPAWRRFAHPCARSLATLRAGRPAPGERARQLGGDRQMGGSPVRNAALAALPAVGKRLIVVNWPELRIPRQAL